MAGAVEGNPVGERVCISKSATTATCSTNTAKAAPNREVLHALDSLFAGTFLQRREGHNFDLLSRHRFPAVASSRLILTLPDDHQSATIQDIGPIPEAD